jgi:hypothetical protein
MRLGSAMNRSRKGVTPLLLGEPLHMRSRLSELGQDASLGGLFENIAIFI